MKARIKKMVYSKLYRRNPKHFYGDFVLGSLNSFERKLFDLRNYKKNSSTKSFRQNVKEEKGKWIKSFLEDGILILDGYLEEVVDDIKSEYRTFFEEPVPKNEYKRSFHSSIPEKILISLLNDQIIELFSSALGGQAYLRACPGLNITEPLLQDKTSRELFESKSEPNKGFASVWHRDTPFLLQYHLLLKDIGMNDPHMLYAKGSHKREFGRYAHFASEEFVEDNFEIVHCIGKKGTVYLFNGGDGLHRMKSSPSGRRETVDVLFTAGNDMLVDSCPIENIHDLNLENFSLIQRKSLEYFLK